MHTRQRWMRWLGASLALHVLAGLLCARFAPDTDALWRSPRQAWLGNAAAEPRSLLFLEVLPRAEPAASGAARRAERPAQDASAKSATTRDRGPATAAKRPARAGGAPRRERTAPEPVAPALREPRGLGETAPDPAPIAKDAVGESGSASTAQASAGEAGPLLDPRALSPRRAALGLLSLRDTAGPTCDAAGNGAGCGADAGACEGAPASCRGDDTVARAAQRLQRALDVAATDIPHLEERPAPRVRRRVDGSYHYRGAAFDAIIEPDGHTRFEDRLAEGSLLPLGFSFDLTDLVERQILGREIYAAEKRWFLAETAELRERLIAQARGKQLEGGLLHLRGRLLRLIEDDSRTPAERRAAVFALWDECDNGGEGLEGQKTIEAFVRERMPQGTELGYGEAELSELNALRTSMRRFAPYSAA